MTKIKTVIAQLRRKFAMTPEQADLVASIKFPCC